MAYAHTRELPGGVGVIHRDLKPSNLLVTLDGHLKVTDFGLARVFREQVKAVGASAAVAGTLAYMAPEQLRDADAVDRRADIYAFGLLVHEMLIGTNPLEATAVPDQIRRILNDVPPPLTDVPDALRALAARCVAKDPDERPQDFDEVLATLAGVARDIEHPWHVDPDSIEPALGPTSLVVELPHLRPRRPHAGETFAMELHVRGDVGPGPVDVVWGCPAIEGVEILTPGRKEVVRVDVGGKTKLALRLRAVAAREGTYRVPASLLTVRGPKHEVVHSIAPVEVDVAFAFHQRLVGRAPECAQIRGAIDELERGRGELILVFGPRGSGRSRMLREIERITAAANIRSIHSHAGTRSERPMRLLHDTARELLSLSRGRASSVRSAVNAMLGDHPATARFFAEVLLGGMPVERDAPIVQHWFTLAREATRAGPLVLLFDNLHRADEAVGRICFEISARAQEAGLPLLIVGSVATEVDDPEERRRIDGLRDAMVLWERRGMRTRSIELDPLTEADVALLVDSVFPGHSFMEETAWFLPVLLDSTGGNPAHVSEVLRVLRRGEERLVTRDDGGDWRASSALTPERLRSLVPRALDEAVRARLASLSPDSFRRIATAALIGDEFDTAVLRAAVPDPDAVEEALSEWEGLGLIRSSDAELDRYALWSVVVPFVVERILGERDAALLRRLHGNVADAMIEVFTDEERRTRRALGIARHLRAAGRDWESLSYTLRGCKRLLGQALSARARQLLEAARPLVEPESTDENMRARFDLLYGIACAESGAYEEALDALERFVRVATRLGGFRRRDIARAQRRLGDAHRARGDYDEAERAYEDARAILEAVKDHRTVAFIYCSLGELALDRGDLAAAESSIECARSLSEERGNEGAAIQARILEGRWLLAARRGTDARAAFHDAERRASELGDRRRRATALRGLGHVALATGYVSQARVHLREAIELHALMGDRAGLGGALVLLGDVHRDTGRSDLALHSYRRAQRVFGEIGRPEGEAEALFHSGRVLRMRARTTAAVRDLAAASEKFARLRHPARAAALAELAIALAESNADRPARLALARSDRAWVPGYERRTYRVVSRAVRARLAMARGDLRLAGVLAARARRHASRTTGHAARIVAHRISAEVAVRRGDLVGARRDAETALAFAHESGVLLEAAAAERVLLEMDARAGRATEAAERAHRIARVYTGRVDVGGEPWRLLTVLARGLARTNPAKAAGYRRAAARCAQRLEARGFRAAE
jgi:tetratricopeptide (TPR) repeat protein